MGLDAEILVANDAQAVAHDSRWANPWRRAYRLESLLKQVCSCFYTAKTLYTFNKLARETERGEATPNRIATEQRLAAILCDYAEDKSNPPIPRNDGAYDIGLRSLPSLAGEVAERIGQIVRFRDVLARNLLDQREEYERKLGELRDQIRLKDEALLAAAERIKGQSEILTAAAGRATYRRRCENIHPPYSGKCEHCQPPSPQDLADMAEPQGSD